MGNVTDTGTSRPHRFRAVGLYVAAWTAVALFFASQGLLNNLYDEAPEPAGDLLAVGPTDWYVRALVAVPVLFGARSSSRRAPPTPRPPRSRLDRLSRSSRSRSAGGLGFVLPWLQPIGFLNLPAGRDPPRHPDLWVVIGLVHWRESRLRLREREREAARLALQASQLETRLARAQLTLKMQLQPHFLFNTLIPSPR